MTNTPLALSNYFIGPKMVCPYARTVEHKFFADEDLNQATIADWANAVLGHAVSVVYDTKGERNFGQAKMWAHETFDKIFELFSPFETDLCTTSSRTPFLVVHETAFYTIGLGPQYPETHPRYAPHLCLVSVNENDIKAVPHIIRQSIQKDLVKRVGAVYDADYTWLALEPKPKTGKKE